MGSLALRPGDLLTILKMALSIGFRSFSFLPSCYPSYGVSDSYPGGLIPTEHASLCWTRGHPIPFNVLRTTACALP